MTSKFYTAAVCMLFLLGSNAAFAQLTANAGRDTTICAGSNITLGGAPTATGGTPGYTYLWTPSLGLSSDTIPNPVVNPVSTTTYTVVVTDSALNTSTDTVLITVNPIPTPTFTVSSPTCVGQAVTVTYTGNGVTNATYSWNFVDGTNIVDLGGVQGPYQTTFNSSGQRYLTLSILQNDCRSATDSVAVTVGALYTSAFTATSPVCTGQNSTITYTGNGLQGAGYQWGFDGGTVASGVGQGPYQINWNTAGTKNVTLSVVDSGCSLAVTTVPVTVNLTPTATFTVTSPVCAGQTATITYTGNASAAPTYSWNFVDGQNIVDLGGVQGPYQATFNSSGQRYLTLSILQNGCRSATDSVMINVGGWHFDSLTTVPANCYGDSSGKICIYATDGNPPFTYQWSNFGNAASNCQTVSAGIYSVTAFDNSGCSVSASGTVAQPLAPLSDSIAVTNVSCNGGHNGSACMYVTGGTPPYSDYPWSNGATTQCISLLTAGVYSVGAVYDAHGCSTSDSTTISQPAPIQDSIAVTNVACYGASSGSICISVSGGTPAYTFNWSNSLTGQCITSLAHGQYNVTITDAIGCSASASATVTQQPMLTDSVVVTNVSCNGGNNGALCSYPVGGAPPYSYMWSNGGTTQCIESLSAADFILTVTDANQCSATITEVVTEAAAALTFDSVSRSGGWCNDGGATLCDYTSGGTLPYNYLWREGTFSNTATGQCIVTTSEQNWVIVTDANGCFDSVYVAILLPSQLAIQLATPDSNGVPDSVSMIINGGSAPYSVIWGDGQTSNLPDSTVLHVYQAPGIYLDSITDRYGCVTTYLVDAGCSDQCVWPGDANYDGVVDNNDLLAIGVGYDSTGYVRSHPTINFIPQYCQSWNDTLTGGVNFKHVDCNGDGIINANDTDAIVLNYSLTHVRGGSGSLQWRDDAPALYIKTSPDTIGDGEILTATLSLGNISMPVANVYALAFTYNFDPLVVDTTGVNIVFGNSWLFGTGDHINISKNFYGSGQIQAAATRIDHANRSGYGNIATVSMKITTGNINGKNLQYYLMNNYISNLTVIDNEGHVLVVNAGTDSAVVSYLPTDVITAGNAKGLIQIFPNPATDQLNVVSAQSEIEEITIFDLAGQQVMHQNMQAGNYSVIDISGLSAGVYMVKLKTADNEYRSRFVKVSEK